MNTREKNSAGLLLGLTFIAVGVIVLLYNVFIYEKVKPQELSSNEQQATSTPLAVNFDEKGHVVMRATGDVLIYEHPGAPALETKLIIDTNSTCTSNNKAVACVTLNQTLDSVANDKLVHVTGHEQDGVTTIATFTVLESEQYGFIKAIRPSGPNVILDIDRVEYLYGDKAFAQAMTDSGCSRATIEDCVPSLYNNFYIRNTDKTIESHLLSLNAAITVFKKQGSPDLESVQRDVFINRYQNKDEHMTSYPFKFELNGDTITSLEEQYMP